MCSSNITKVHETYVSWASNQSQERGESCTQRTSLPLDYRAFSGVSELNPTASRLNLGIVFMLRYITLNSLAQHVQRQLYKYQTENAW